MPAIIYAMTGLKKPEKLCELPCQLFSLTPQSWTQPLRVVKSFNKWAFLLPKTLLDGFLQLLYPVGLI